MLHRHLVGPLPAADDEQPDNDEERWMPIDGYPRSYEVSTYGRVKSLPRTIHVERNGQQFSYDRGGKVLQPSMHSGGAVIVTLHHNGRYNSKTLRRLVAIAFIPCPDEDPDQMIVSHLDKNPWNCRADNLVWRKDYRKW